MEKKIATITKDKAQRRKRILQDMMRTIVFYEAKGRFSKQVKASSPKKKSAVNKEKVHKQVKTPNKNTQNEEDISKQVNLTDEEKQALNELVVEIQNQDFEDTKENCNNFEDGQKVNAQSIEEMHEISYTYSKDSCFNTKFLDFDTEFDAGMLWDDTNLDDYADLFTDRELKILKDKQRKFNPRSINSNRNDSQSYSIFGNDFEISEDDYEEDIVYDNVYAEKFEISEDDFE